MLFPPARQIFFGCLKYKNKEKPKAGSRPSPRLSYDVKIGPRGVKCRGRDEMQGRNHVFPSGGPPHRRALRIVLTPHPPYGAHAYMVLLCLFYSENRHMIVFPHPNCSTTCNILNQHLEVINTILRQLLYSILCV